MNQMTLEFIVKMFLFIAASMAIIMVVLFHISIIPLFVLLFGISLFDSELKEINNFISIKIFIQKLE
ncbi:MAG: hypothetical protein ACYCWE_15920 [Eubacteriales bacterium]